MTLVWNFFHALAWLSALKENLGASQCGGSLLGIVEVVVLKFSCYFGCFDKNGLVMNENRLFYDDGLVRSENRLFYHCAGMLWSWNG